MGGGHAPTASASVFPPQSRVARGSNQPDGVAYFFFGEGVDAAVPFAEGAAAVAFGFSCFGFLGSRPPFAIDAPPVPFGRIYACAAVNKAWCGARRVVKPGCRSIDQAGSRSMCRRERAYRLLQVRCLGSRQPITRPSINSPVRSFRKPSGVLRHSQGSR